MKLGFVQIVAELLTCSFQLIIKIDAQKVCPHTLMVILITVVVTYVATWEREVQSCRKLYVYLKYHKRNISGNRHYVIR